MKGGFSFCGVDIEDIGLEYAPENKDTYVYAPAETSIHEETFEGHNGGYFYGSYKQPKTFTLRCIYEDTHISEGIMTKIFDLFRAGNKGMLIFKKRPWCYYYATVTENPNITEMSSYLNGIVTITMKAYYPFARSTREGTSMFYCLSSENDYEQIMENSGLLNIAQPLSTSFGSNESPITAARTFYLFNPGTEKAKVGLRMSGTAGTGFTLYNRNTDQKCRYILFTPETADEVYTDGISGKTTSEKNGSKKLSFLYHDYGFLELEPSYPVVRNIRVTTNGTTSATSDKPFYTNETEKEWCMRKHIYTHGGWREIVEITDDTHFTISSSSSSGTVDSCIILLNKIVFTPTGGTSLTKLEFDYKPTFA